MNDIRGRRTLRLLCACLLSCGLFALASLDRERPPLVILFSNSSNGILRACYCPNSPWGGLAKRAWLVDRIRAEAGPDNVLLVDTGDLFPSESDPEILSFILRSYALMKYDAVAVGDQELLDGYPAWKALADNPALPVPWLSAGYRITRGDRAGDFIATPRVTRIAAGYRVGILSVAGPDAYRFADTNRLAGLKLTDPRVTVSNFVAQFKTETDLLIVLSHQGLDADRELARVVPGVDLIIGGHSQSIVCPPEIVNGTAIVQAGKNGENLGFLVLTPSPSASSARSIPLSPASPFAPAAVVTPKWRMAARLVPLDTSVDEEEETAKVIDAYYRLQDQRMEKRLTEPPIPADESPRLRVKNPIQSAVMRFGETGRFSVVLENVGKADLEIRKARSKIRWLSVTNVPSRLAPGASGEIVLSLTATNIDRYFRSEYTVTSSDTNRVVVMGAVNGRIDGDIPGLINVDHLLASLLPPSPTAPSIIPPSSSSNSPSASAPTLPLFHFSNSVSSSAPPSSSPVLVEFFYAPGCDECGEMEDEVLPALRRRFAGKIALHEYSIYDRTQYLRLARLQETLKIRTNEKVSLYLDGRVHLGGLRAIRDGAAAEIEKLLAQRAGAVPVPSAGPAPGVRTAETPDLLADRLNSFTVAGIAVAGLVDGLNPCAFATIIFFITLLSVTYKEKKPLLLVGVFFCLASFATYLLLGLGVFEAFLKLNSYKTFSGLLRWAMVAFLLILAGVSVKDAVAFHRTGRPQDVTLQLPDGLKRRIHAIMRSNLGLRSLVLGSLVTGVLVTLLESVCTGQVYVPTLAYLTSHPELHRRAWALLVLYNAMFTVPLVIVFVAAYRGAGNAALLDWSRRNVVWGKSLMAALFLILAAVMLWL